MKKVTKVPLLTRRANDSHKGTFGRVAVIGGSLGMSGAPALAAKAALRCGAGLVQLAVPESILKIVAAVEPCYTTVPLPEDAGHRMSTAAKPAILKAAADNDVTAFGPGAGTSAALKSIVLELIGVEGLRLVVDADGLNNLSGAGQWHNKIRAKAVLTPHPGELSRLWEGLFRDKMPEDDRRLQALEMAKRTGTTVVLKGWGTVVSDGHNVYVNTTGNPGMATGGSGDVLAGMIAALMGQGLSNFDACVLGVYVHGLAGDMAAKELGQMGLIASDIIEYLPKALLGVHGF